jgi:hypothetical protein
VRSNALAGLLLTGGHYDRASCGCAEALDTGLPVLAIMSRATVRPARGSMVPDRPRPGPHRRTMNYVADRIDGVGEGLRLAPRAGLSPAFRHRLIEQPARTCSVSVWGAQAPTVAAAIMSRTAASPGACWGTDRIREVAAKRECAAEVYRIVDPVPWPRLRRSARRRRKAGDDAGQA